MAFTRHPAALADVGPGVDVWAGKGAEEANIARSGLDWVVVRAPRLVNGPRRGKIVVLPDGGFPGGTISRADLAAFMLDQLTDLRYLGHRPHIAAAA